MSPAGARPGPVEAACGRAALVRTPSFDVGLYRLPPGFRSERHSHAEPGLVVGLLGNLELAWRRAGGPIGLSAETFAFLPAGLPHHERSPAGALCLLAQPRGAVAAQGLRLDRPAGPLGPPRDPELAAARLHAEFLRGDALAALALEALLLELLGEPEAPARALAIGERVRRAARRLQEECVEPPGLPQLADEAGVSVDHFSRSFRRLLGCTVPEYVRRARLRRATSMLRSSREPIAEVALACGFADQSHLTRQLRGETGWTPAGYRRRHARLR